MNAPPDHHSVTLWLERGVLFLGLLYLGVHTMPRAWTALNTDFPNYYLSARLAHERFDTAREYEWAWLAREKDHRALDIRIIGLLPITPFSTLALSPVAGLPPLTAKHIWILFNLALLVPITILLSAVTGLSRRRVAILFVLSFPLHRNFLYGQFYVLLLLLIVGACWAWLRGRSALAGSLVAVAALSKIFPALLFVFFLQRRDGRALLSGLFTALAGVGVSVAVFGWNLHRTWFHEILPWTLCGEALPPYVTSSASISSVLHYLFLAEPQWNPHPWRNSLLSYALLQPTLQTLALAPAILLIRRDSNTPPGRVLPEWSALLTAALAISTSPASYNFVLMVFPVAVLAACLLERRKYLWMAALLIVYLGIGYPVSGPTHQMGPAILLYVPRLPLMFALLIALCILLWRDHPVPRRSWNWTQSAWALALVVSAALGIHSTFHREKAMRQEYAWRLPLAVPSFLDATPQPADPAVAFVAFTQTGYHLVTDAQPALPIDPSPDDDLSFATRAGHTWVERALSPRSRIIDLHDPAHAIVDGAREPSLSADGRSLAFIRDDHGRGRLVVRPAFLSGSAGEAPLTPPALNVYEASFRSDKEFAFSAVANGNPPGIYLTDAAHFNTLLPLGEARYPALSPDGRWLAYSRLEHGAWNLWIRDEKTGATRRLADVPCNQIQPAWEDDSRSLLYAVDCGRSLWFTAVARRQVIP